MIEDCLVSNSKRVSELPSTSTNTIKNEFEIKKKDKRSLPTAAKLPRKKLNSFPLCQPRERKNSILIQSTHKKSDAVNNARIHNA